MEEMVVNDNDIQGWVADYLQNHKIEEQRKTPEYESGYEDGMDKTSVNFKDFC